MADLAQRVDDSGLLGNERVSAVALVAPPGSTLYNSVAGKAKLAGPIGQAIGSKRHKTEGLAGEVPRKMSALAVTPTRVLFLKVPTRFSNPKEILVEWSRDLVSLSFDSGDGRYPFVDLRFSDGSTSRCFGDKKASLEHLQT